MKKQDVKIFFETGRHNFGIQGETNEYGMNYCWLEIWLMLNFSSDSVDSEAR